MPAINYLFNHLISYPLKDTDRKHECEMIKCILCNNKYDPHILERSITTTTTELQTQEPIHTAPQTQHADHTTPPKKTIWFTFTYFDPETKFIMKLFKHTNIKTVYKTKKYHYNPSLSPNTTSLCLP
jgi:hypothetical protein